LGLANIASSRHELEARTAELRCHLPELEAKARCALRAGRQDVARHALERRQIAAGELALLNEQLREADLEATRLAAAEQQLAARIDAILARERMIEARQSVAEIQVRVRRWPASPASSPGWPPSSPRPRSTPRRSKHGPPRSTGCSIWDARRRRGRREARRARAGALRDVTAGRPGTEGQP